MSAERSGQFVSRAGEKLAHALDAFNIDPAGLKCVDLGSNVGGFVDCLLQRGCGKVYSVDTSKGALAWSLRNDARVVVLDGTSAMHVDIDEPVDLVTIDVGWTRQQLVIPRAIEMLDDGGRIVSLIKPHYEADAKLLRRGVLPEEHVESVVSAVLERLADWGVEIVNTTDSPIAGDKGNREVLTLMMST